MVFKAVSGIGQDILAAYRSKIPSNEHERQEMDVRKGNGHYKNRILLDANWRKFNPTSVSSYFVEIFPGPILFSAGSIGQNWVTHPGPFGTGTKFES